MEGQRAVQVACYPTTRARVLLVVAALARLEPDEWTLGRFATEAVRAELARRRRGRRGWPRLTAEQAAAASWPGRRKGVPHRRPPMTADLLVALPVGVVDEARRAVPVLDAEIAARLRELAARQRWDAYEALRYERVTVAELIRAGLRRACDAALARPDVSAAAEEVGAIWRHRRRKTPTVAIAKTNAAAFIRWMTTEPAPRP